MFRRLCDVINKYEAELVVSSTNGQATLASLDTRVEGCFGSFISELFSAVSLVFELLTVFWRTF